MGDMATAHKDFYVRYYVGHKGKFGEQCLLMSAVQSDLQLRAHRSGVCHCFCENSACYLLLKIQQGSRRSFQAKQQPTPKDPRNDSELVLLRTEYTGPDLRLLAPSCRSLEWRSKASLFTLSTLYPHHLLHLSGLQK